MPQRTDIKLDDATLRVKSSKGKIASQQKWSETSVSSSGGGGRVGPYGGRVHAPTIHSTATENHEFWICEDDGTETSIQLNNAGFHVREGQTVWVAWGGNANKKSGNYLFAYNYASRQFVETQTQAQFNHWLFNEGLLKVPLVTRLIRTCLPLLLVLMFVSLLWPEGTPDNPQYGNKADLLMAAFVLWLGVRILIRFCWNTLVYTPWFRQEAASIKAKILAACPPMV